MKITILGSGSAYGSPTAGNYTTDNIDLSNYKNIRLRPSFYLEDSGDKLLVECSPDFRQQINTYNIKTIENIFISHGHCDHIIGVWELTKLAKTIQKTINIYADNQTTEEIENMFPFMFKTDFKEMGEGSVVLKPIKDNQTFTSFKLFPLKFLHKGKETTGFRYKDFCFIPDLEAICETSEEYLYDAKLWILENNNLNDEKNGHNYLEQSLKWIEKFKPKQVILNHLNTTIDYEKVSKMLPKGVELAWDGMIVEI
ncbi:MAG: MBL fold metallo-hydrolase [Rickettsiales bacterium]|nr:MAG: MBL fold metallo-hydrolase [Rickettsiales bacterium]